MIAPAIVPGANYPAVMRNRPSMLFALLACLLLVLLGLAMVIAGWSGQTVTQRLLLDLAQLPIVAAVLVGVVSMVGSRRLWRRRAFTTTFAGAGLILLVGVVLLVVGYAMDRPSLSLAAMTLIWLAVGVAFLYVAVDMVRHPSGDRPLLITDYLDDDDLDWAGEGPDDADLFPEGLLDEELPSASEPQGPADPAPASADDTPDSIPDPDDQPGQPSA